MYAIVHTHIDLVGVEPHNDSKMEVISRHRFEATAVKKMVKMIPAFYGWDSEEEFEDLFPGALSYAGQEGKYVVWDEESGEWGDMLAVLEL